MLQVKESTLGHLYLGDSGCSFYHVDSILPVVGVKAGGDPPRGELRHSPNDDPSFLCREF